MTGARAAYRRLLTSGELDDRVRLATELLRHCSLCGRACEVDRIAHPEDAGCRTGARAVVDGVGAHHGEEPPLTGTRGSGTIFFSWCNLRCRFCQNWEISQLGIGREVDAADLADMMLELQALGCHNVNLVSPTHVVPQVLEALALAARDGLRLPIVYNTGGYDSAETLRLLDGVIDIYMPDMKYGDSRTAMRTSGISRYVEVNQAAVREMHRQVGDLVVDERGLAVRGLLVRHLVLPGGLAGTEEVVRFLATEISRETYLNLMDQYRPAYRASEIPELDRRISRDEFEQAVALARRYGLTRLA